VATPSQISLNQPLYHDPSRQYLDITFHAGGDDYDGLDGQYTNRKIGRNGEKQTYRTVADAERQALIKSKFNLQTKRMSNMPSKDQLDG